MKKHMITGLALAALLPQANATELASGVYIAPTISHQNFGGNVLGDDFNLDSNEGFGIGLGYQFASPWAVELMYNAIEADVDGADAEVDAEYTHLDVLYHLKDGNGDNWAPYWVAGIGQQAYDEDSYDETDLQLNAGIGVRHTFNSNFYFRADARATLGEEDSDVGTLFNIGLVYIFGEAKSSPVKTVNEPVVQQAAAPQPASAPAPAPAPTSKPAPKDSDNDGVFNNFDQCPDTKAGAKVDEKGCYLMLKETKAFTLNVKFKTSSSQIEAASKSEIKGLADFLTSYPQTKVTIEGHSDSRGAAAFNKKLSQQRADSVKASLISDYGVEASRITAEGFGEEQPIADNATAEGRAKNRRVVAKVSTVIEKIAE